MNYKKKKNDFLRSIEALLLGSRGLWVDQKLGGGVFRRRSKSVFEAVSFLSGSRGGAISFKYDEPKQKTKKTTTGHLAQIISYLSPITNSTFFASMLKLHLFLISPLPLYTFLNGSCNPLSLCPLRPPGFKINLIISFEWCIY